MSVAASNGGCICYHLLENEDLSIYRQFTGLGVAYNLFCNLCKENLDTLDENLREVSSERFKEIDYNCEGYIGEAEILQRTTNLKFIHTLVGLHEPLPGTILSIQPENGVETSTWIAVLTSGDIVQIELDSRKIKKLCSISPGELILSEKVALHLSPNNQLAAVVNDREALGVVIDLATGRVTMKLNRGTYHPAQTAFPVAFFQDGHEVFLVHGTQWNRLDVSNPMTGKLLTERSYAPRGKGDLPPEHYLDYFHSLPVISPDAKWIVEDGWIWSPYGVTRLWNLNHWLTQNVWESEDGLSLKSFNGRSYYWGASLCWVNNQTIAVWGFGNDDYCMVPAVQLFEVETGKLLRWFAGPKSGNLYFDTYLFSCSKEGTDIWDVNTGERLLQDAETTPIGYHAGTKQFLSPVADGGFRLSHLTAS
jgi:hypothetical protein